jgi:hypothetical protein
MGQKDWKDAGADVNSYIVASQIDKGAYRMATVRGVFGELNAFRSNGDVETDHKGNTVTITSGAKSPVWEKTPTENNTVRFTMVEPSGGMATYGDADTKPGEHTNFMHASVECRRVRSPAFPVLGFESQDNAKRAVPDLAKLVKENLIQWASEEMDFDGFRGLLEGRSRGLGMTVDGGKAISLFNGTSGQIRVPWNCFVGNSGTLVNQNASSAATHNGNLATAINGLTASDTNYFSYKTHGLISLAVDELLLKPVTIGGVQYRAVVIIDQRNIDRMRQDDKLLSLWTNATARADDNKALYRRGRLVLDDILYMPVTQLRKFRPVAESGTVRFGAGDNYDPRKYVGTSDITITMVLGAGALMRARRKKGLAFTAKRGDHKLPDDGYEMSAIYDDGWMRQEWYNKDERAAQMKCDSSFFLFHRDAGPGMGV